MTLYTKKEISNKLNNLAKRIDSILEFIQLIIDKNLTIIIRKLIHYDVKFLEISKLELTYDVKFLKGLAKRYLNEPNLDLNIFIPE